MLIAGCGGAGATGGPGGATTPPTVKPAATTSGNGGLEQTYEACPLTLAEATSLAKEPMQVQPVSRGDGSFRSEVVGENTTWICTYDAVAWTSDYNFTMHLDFSVGGSADRRWAILGEPSAEQGWTRLEGSEAWTWDAWLTATSMRTVDLWEDVSYDEPGKHDVAIEVRDSEYLINVDVAEYGGTRSGEEVHDLAIELVMQVLEALPL